MNLIIGIILVLVGGTIIGMVVGVPFIIFLLWLARQIVEEIYKKETP